MQPSSHAATSGLPPSGHWSAATNTASLGGQRLFDLAHVLRAGCPGWFNAAAKFFAVAATSARLPDRYPWPATMIRVTMTDIVPRYSDNSYLGSEEDHDDGGLPAAAQATQRTHHQCEHRG